MTGKAWITCAAANKEFGWSQPTLLRWHREGVPLLRGRKLPSRIVSSQRTAHSIRVFHRPTSLQLARVVTSPNDEWRTARELQAEFGIGAGNFSRWSKYGTPELGGKRLRTTLSQGQHRVRLFHRPTIQRLVANSNDTGRWATATELAEELQCAKTSIYNWHRDGIPSMAGRKLSAKAIYVLLPARNGTQTLRKVICFDREMARRAIEAQAPVDAVSVRDVAARWGVAENSVRRALSDGRLIGLRARSGLGLK